MIYNLQLEAPDMQLVGDAVKAYADNAARVWSVIGQQAEAQTKAEIARLEAEKKAKDEAPVLTDVVDPELA